MLTKYPTLERSHGAHQKEGKFFGKREENTGTGNGLFSDPWGLTVLYYLK